DLARAGKLEEIRLEAATLVDGELGFDSADRAYAAFFREHGLAAECEEPEVVGARIRASPIRAQLVAALDDWAVRTRVGRRRAWLHEVARRGAGGGRWRDPAVWGDPKALARLAEGASRAELSPQLLLALAQALGSSGGNRVPLLKAAQESHPNDFWLNFEL